MPNERRILVGVPIPPSYMANTKTVAQLEAWHAYDNVETYYPATCGPEIGQDRIVQFALHGIPKATHILFVDYDVIPRPNTLKRLLSHDKDIIAGVYPMSFDSCIAWCMSREEPFVPLQINDLPNNLFKAKTVSNGMMLVKTEVFDKLEWPYFKHLYIPGTLQMGHDVYFCQKAREAGYDLWVDPKVKCEHIKTVGLLGIAKKYLMKGKKQ